MRSEDLEPRDHEALDIFGANMAEHSDDYLLGCQATLFQVTASVKAFIDDPTNATDARLEFLAFGTALQAYGRELEAILETRGYEIVR